MNQLEPCPHCHRHVNVHEAACPFCAGSLAAFANLPPRVAPRVRLGRAAVFAFGVATLAQACGDNLPPAIPHHDAASIPPDTARDAGVLQDADNADNDGSVAIYSAAPTQDGGTPSRS